MGVLYLFSCPACNYSKRASQAWDRGKLAAVEPMVCNDCHELQNVVVKYYDEYRDITHLRKDSILQCNYCHSKNLKSWTDHKCPKCNNTMDDGELDLIWD